MGNETTDQKTGVVHVDSAGLLGAETLAKQFHETYERLAPQFGYETKEETRQFQSDSPNGRLMIAVCSELLASTVDCMDSLRLTRIRRK